ncbi:unnamed protein product [Onchocerca flexuosa]|uniref:Transmembrane protein n=1 Tax=Onchocerca flexuosa TaxID=387005 RepID=A0A183HQ56_9BILA|nr:unnamed protein product [Onchocerca flexuosa]
MTNDKALRKEVQSAVYPELEGGPLMHVIGCKNIVFTILFGYIFVPLINISYAKSEISSLSSNSNDIFSITETSTPKVLQKPANFISVALDPI